MKVIISLIFFLLLFPVADSFSQADKKVNEYLKMVAAGRIMEVKMRLPDLMAEYPDDPGVHLLHGVVIEDAYRALDIYKDIIKKYPESQWADDAYWRIVQFHAILGDTVQARIMLHKFRQNYPTSEYLSPASDVVRSAVGLARAGKKQTPRQLTSRREEPEEVMIDLSEEPEKENKPATNPVRDENPEPRDESLSKYVSSPPAGKKDDTDKPETYGLQVAIFSSRDAADAEMEKFLKQRMRTEVLEKVVNGEVLYAVVIGSYPTRQSAEEAKQIVQQQCACKPIVFKK